MLKRLLIILLTPTLCFSTSAISGNVRDLSSAAISNRVKVKATILNCQSPTTAAGITGVPRETLFPVDGSGNFSGTLYRTDEVTCLDGTQNAYYHWDVSYNGISIWTKDTYITTGTANPADLPDVTPPVPVPATPNAVVTNPTGDQVVTQPSTSRLYVNHFTVTDCVGCGGAPGGSDTQVQFNDGGTTFGGATGLTWDKTNNLAVSSALIAGTNDTNAITNFGFHSSQYPIASFGATPLLSIGDISDAHPGDEFASFTGGNFGTYFTRTAGDFALMSAIELDAQKNSGGNVSGMAGSNLFISNIGAGTVGYFKGYTVNTYNEGTISGDVIGVDVGHLTNVAPGTVGGNAVGVRVQSPAQTGTTAGYAAGLDIQSFAGIGTTANYGLHIADQGLGANDYPIYTAGGHSSFSDLYVRPNFTFGVGDDSGTVGLFCASTSSSPTCYVRPADGSLPIFQVLGQASGGTNHGKFETDGNLFSQTGHDSLPSTIDVDNDTVTANNVQAFTVNADAGGTAKDAIGILVTGSATGNFTAIQAQGLVKVDSLKINGSQSLTGVQGTTGTKAAAATGSFTSGNGVKTDANGNFVDGGAAYGTACATCVISAASLTSGQLMAGAGGQAAQVSNLSGDVTTSGTLATTVVKVNGVAYSASPSTDTIPVITASNTSTYKAVPDCQDTTGNHLNYTASTHTIGCGTSIPAVNNFAYGGSGLDGALAFDGVTTIPCATLASTTYTLTRECYATTLVLSNGVTINTNNAGQCYIILATTSMSISGTIQSVGPAGSNAAGKNGGSSAGQQPCRGGSTARIGTQSAGASTTAANGVSGGGGTSGVGGGGSTGANTVSSGSANYCPAGASGTGAAGGAGGAGVSAAGALGAGGTGGGTTPNTLANTINDGHTIWAWREPAGTQTFSTCYYGGGGGGGSAGGGNGVQSGGDGGGSGAGGGGGGVVFLSSPIITVAASGVISANGGVGGNGANGTNGQAGGGATGGGGGGAGGTGGPGGFVVLVYHTYTNSGSVTASGGSGGTLGTKGTGTAGGANGSDGNTGLAGKNGVVFQFAN